MSTNKVRKTHTAEFKAEALKLVNKICVAAAARELKLYESQLYNWRPAAEKKSLTSERESELAAEVDRLNLQPPTSRRTKSSPV